MRVRARMRMRVTVTILTAVGACMTRLHDALSCEKGKRFKRFKRFKVLPMSWVNAIGMSAGIRQSIKRWTK